MDRTAEQIVQDALDEALRDSEGSLLARAGRSEQMGERTALTFAFEINHGLIEAVKGLATEVDRLRLELDRRSGRVTSTRGARRP